MPRRRRNCRAPRFWLVKVREACATELEQVNTKPSILEAAALPAMTVLPKELTEDWIRTLEMEKMAPCIPAGTPIFRMRTSFSRCRASLFGLIW